MDTATIWGWMDHLAAWVAIGASVMIGLANRSKLASVDDKVDGHLSAMTAALVSVDPEAAAHLARALVGMDCCAIPTREPSHFN